MSSGKLLTGRRRKAIHKPPYSQGYVEASFLGCYRCSSFLSGYRLIHNDFEKAVQESNDGWLHLTWDEDVRFLTYKVYGTRIDMDVFHYEGVCADCRRIYSFELNEGPDLPNRLLVQTIPS